MENSFEYFIGYKDNKIFEPLRIILPKTSGHKKFLMKLNAPILITDDEFLENYNKTWNKVSNTIKIPLDSELVFS